MTRETDALPRFDASPMLAHLSIRTGPRAGASLLYCTCGWETFAPTLDETIRLGEQHNRLCGSTWYRSVG